MGFVPAGGATPVSDPGKDSVLRARGGRQRGDLSGSGARRCGVASVLSGPPRQRRHCLWPLCGKAVLARRSGHCLFTSQSLARSVGDRGGADAGCLDCLMRPALAPKTVPGRRLALVSRHAGPHHRPDSGGGPIHGRPLHLHSEHRFFHRGRMGGGGPARPPPGRQALDCGPRRCSAGRMRAGHVGPVILLAGQRPAVPARDDCFARQLHCRELPGESL